MQGSDYENKRSEIRVTIEYSNHRYTQCRDCKAFKVNPFQKIFIQKDNVKIEESMIVMTGYMTDEHVLEVI